MQAAHDVDEHEHYSQRSPWLRAFVLGALDGLVSVAATIVGVAGGSSSLQLMRITGVAAWVAGSLGMAAGEYVSVSSQRDCEEADIAKEREMVSSSYFFAARCDIDCLIALIPVPSLKKSALFLRSNFSLLRSKERVQRQEPMSSRSLPSSMVSHGLEIMKLNKFDC